MKVMNTEAVTSRTIAELTKEDFYSFFPNRDDEVTVMGEIGRYWAIGYYPKDEYFEKTKDQLPVDAKTLLYELEEADHDNVFTCDKDGIIAYGLSDEMRYFIPLKTMAEWIQHLQNRGINLQNQTQ
jgi:hypothetical protein